MAEGTGRIVEIPASEIPDPADELATTAEIVDGAAVGVTAAPVATHAARPRDRRSLGRSIRSLGSGIAAVGVKELRGRMRGRRAFVILTVYLLFLAAFAWAWQLIAERAYGGNGLSGGSAAFASALIGQEIFGALLIVETLLVVFLAPAMTAGAISLEREKQTLDMLATTPISSLAIVIGKLLSALTYVFILIVASIPLTAMVFVFGGVGPDEVLRGYVVLFVTAIGLGSLGLFISALMQRTQAATVVTFFGVLALTMGTLFVVLFWTTMAGIGPNQTRLGSGGLGPIKGRPPEALLWYNPFAAQYDVICGASDGYGGWCSRLADVTNGAISIGIGGGATGGVPVTGVDTSGGNAIVPRQGCGRRRRPGPAVRHPARHVLAAERRGVAGAVGGSRPRLRPARLAHPPLAPAVPAGVARDCLMRFPRPSLPAAARRAGDRPVRDAVVAPPDPRSLGTPIDPLLESIRADLRPHLRRLWARRIVRRAWLVAGAVLVAEVALFAIGRIVPIEVLSALALAIPIVGLVILVGLAAAARPRIGETALAVDAEGHLGDRVSSALELAVAFPDYAGPRVDESPALSADDGGRRDAPRPSGSSGASGATRASSLRIAPPGLFRPRFSRRPAAVALVASLLLVPVRRCCRTRRTPSIAQQPAGPRRGRTQQAERIDEHRARTSRRRAQDPNDPRTRLAQELRDLARQLRDRPGRPRRQPRPARRDRDRRPRAARPGERAAGVVADLAEPRPVAGRDRQAGREPRRRPREGAPTT